MPPRRCQPGPSGRSVIAGDLSPRLPPRGPSSTGATRRRRPWRVPRRAGATGDSPSQRACNAGRRDRDRTRQRVCVEGSLTASVSERTLYLQGPLADARGAESRHPERRSRLTYEAPLGGGGWSGGRAVAYHAGCRAGTVGPSAGRTGTDGWPARHTREDLSVRINTAKQKMLRGEPSFGYAIGLGSIVAAEAMANCGIDHILLDRQHGSWGEDSTIAALIAMHGGTRHPDGARLPQRLHDDRPAPGRGLHGDHRADGPHRRGREGGRRRLPPPADRDALVGLGPRQPSTARTTRTPSTTRSSWPSRSRAGRPSRTSRRSWRRRAWTAAGPALATWRSRWASIRARPARATSTRGRWRRSSRRARTLARSPASPLAASRMASVGPLRASSTSSAAATAAS